MKLRERTPSGATPSCSSDGTVTSVRRSWTKLLSQACVASLLFAACAGQAEPEPVGAGDTTTSTVVSSTADAQPTTSSTTDDTSTATSSAAPTNDLTDGTRTPPTTETEGLASRAEPSLAPADLTCVRLEDFGDDSPGRWRVVNDGVMGGRSMGELREEGGVVRFSGVINTNGGGFSLIRTSTLRGEQSLVDALDGVDYLRFRVRSANGRGYELIAEDDVAPSGAIMHFASIPVDGSGDWAELDVSLGQLDARAFGTPLPNSAPFDITQVSSIGVILADGVDGPFSLEIDRIDACSS